MRYRHIDALFGEPIHWQLIEDHWQDLMKVAISIREGELSSITLLRRLRHDPKSNKIYRAFRELGRVIRTMVLLRDVSDATLRENITRATNMVELRAASRVPARCRCDRPGTAQGPPRVREPHQQPRGRRPALSGQRQPTKITVVGRRIWAMRPLQMQITIFPRVRPRSACAWASAIRSRG